MRLPLSFNRRDRADPSPCVPKPPKGRPMPVVDGLATHVTVTPIYDRRYIGAGEDVRYEGPPDWKFEPLDPHEAELWRAKFANPRRVLDQNLRLKVIVRAPQFPAEIEADKAFRKRLAEPVRID